MAVVGAASRGMAWVAASTVFLSLCACGLTNDSSHTAVGSPARTLSVSPALTPTTAGQTAPDATQLTESDCSGPAPATAARPLDRYFKIHPAASWTEIPGPQHTETLLLELAAPEAYGFAPTVIQFHSLLGPVHTIYGPQATAHSIAQQHATAIAQEWSPDAAAGKVSDCHLGGEAAAAFGVSGDLNLASGTTTGKFFWIYFVHNDLLFKVILVGAGGVGDQAITDSLGMLGSLTWTF